MRVLCAIGFATESGVHLYTANPLTKAITAPALEAASKILHDNSAQVEMRLHDYFRIHGYKCPTDGTNCAFQWTFDTNLTYFERIHERPEIRSDFNTFMTGYRNKRKHWVDWFPVELVLGSLRDNVDEHDNFIVDLGGGNGHDLEHFLARFPEANGHLVLQDLPATIAAIQSLSPGIKPMAHDFFSPQPVEGARAYYAHAIFHDWPDDKCRDILRCLKGAMRPGHSKILLNESILPDTGCPSYWAAADINMMAILAGKERTRLDWIELVESVGLVCNQIWESPFLQDVEGIIEVSLPEQ